MTAEQAFNEFADKHILPRLQEIRRERATRYVEPVQHESEPE